ncbi:MAG: hypothetical protein WCK17_06810, partial [Verrucomicrobiota bacterium]
MSSVGIPIKPADAPYLLVLSCADAVAELVKVKALADQAESFRPKLRELSDFLFKYSEVRNEIGKGLSSGQLNETKLTLICESLLSLSKLSESLGALANNSEPQLCKNLPALAGEIASEINNWQVNAAQSGTASFDEVFDVLQRGRALEKDTADKVKKASKLDSGLCDARGLIESAKSLTDCSPHAIFKSATDLLVEAQSATGEKLNGLLVKSKKWGDDFESFSNEYKNLIHFLTDDAKIIDQMMAASTDGCRQSLAEYYGQTASWLAEVRAYLKRAAKISSRSALALGEHSKLKQIYSDSQNLIETLRDKIAECEIFSDKESQRQKEERDRGAKRKQKFVIVGAVIGFVCLLVAVVDSFKPVEVRSSYVGPEMVEVEGGELPGDSEVEEKMVGSFLIGKYEVTWG